MTNDEGCLKQAEPEKNAANWDNFSASDKQWNNFSGLDEWQPGRPPSRHDVIQPLGGLRTQLCIALHLVLCKSIPLRAINIY